MSDVFPKWTNKLPAMVIAGLILVGGAATVGISHYFSPKYTRAGYQPIQPVSFSHAIHADQLGLDCRYCHNGVEKSWYSNIPAAGTCMNCHNQVLKDDPRLAAVRESAATGKPIPWVQIHKLPDYVYFNHSVHVNRGVSCSECHGPVNKMDEVKHEKSLGMPFCLECHRNPEKRLRPLGEVYNLDWERPEGFDKLAESFVHDWKVLPGDSCTVCHR
jgi:formate-dependent nitrite reductase cytochrome c552 subunit